MSVHDNTKLARFTTEGRLRRLYREGTVEEKQAQVDRVHAHRTGVAGLRADYADLTAGGARAAAVRLRHSELQTMKRITAEAEGKQ